ncbi:MAG: cytochrome-c peroxidase [Bacteroidia bacterium]|nr:cytochrome-c peroxidase [Bacteroidia bacterium]
MKLTPLNLSKTNLFFHTLSFALALFFLNLKQKDPDQYLADFVCTYVNKEIGHSMACLDSMQNAILISQRIDKAIWYYQHSRNHFKKISFFLDFYYPAYVRMYLNGPNVPKAEFEFGYKTLYPHGYQVIEENLFSDSIPEGLIRHEVALMKQTYQYFLQKNSQKEIRPDILTDMFRFELFRIMSLYLGGYDAIKTGKFREEIAIQLQTMMEFNRKIWKNNSLSTKIEKAIKYASIKKEPFKRLIYIRNFLVPLYEEFFNTYSKNDVEVESRFAINIRRKKFYDKFFFNLKYFNTVLHDSTLWPMQANLGRQLFFDPILSGNMKRACASCHRPESGFTTNTALNLNFDRHNFLNRNTPSLINTLFQKNFFIDGRALQLEDQAAMVLLSPNEMHANPDTLVARLRKSNEYRELFRLAFKGSADTSITFYGILKALAQFERTLYSFETPFDKFLQGSANLNEDAIKGYDIFSGKALCGSCHFFPLFNGLVPPFYSEHEYEVLGTPSLWNKKMLSADSGRFHVSKNQIHLFSYKTPGIREWDKTMPYMHNGVFKTMDEVIEFYQKGGGHGFGILLPNQTLPFDSLNLTKDETEKLIAFLNTLNTKNLRFETPSSLPALGNISNRKIGGEY